MAFMIYKEEMVDGGASMPPAQFRMLCIDGPDGPTIKNSYYFMLPSCLMCRPFLIHLTSESELASTARRPNLGRYAILNTGMLCNG